MLDDNQIKFTDFRWIKAGAIGLPDNIRVIEAPDLKQALFTGLDILDIYKQVNFVAWNPPPSLLLEEFMTAARRARAMAGFFQIRISNVTNGNIQNNLNRVLTENFELTLTPNMIDPWDYNILETTIKTRYAEIFTASAQHKRWKFGHKSVRFIGDGYARPSAVENDPSFHVDKSKKKQIYVISGTEIGTHVADNQDIEYISYRHGNFNNEYDIVIEAQFTNPKPIIWVLPGYAFGIMRSGGSWPEDYPKGWNPAYHSSPFTNPLAQVGVIRAFEGHTLDVV